MNKTTLISVFLCFVLVGCESTKSPVVTRATVDRYAESEKIGGRIVTIVQGGDTWYGIAFANGLNVSELTSWNGMHEDDKLKIGQRLRLSKPPGFQAESQVVVANSARNTGKIIVDAKAVEVIPPVVAKVPSVAVQTPTVGSNTSETGEKAKPYVPQRPAKPNQVTVKPISKSVQENIGFSKTVRWAWPLRGKLVSRFSPSVGRKGIDISGKQNEEIKVAAPGKVVYQGNGIKGYSNLIIIKHNDDLLSAYAHSQKVYVREGDWVKTNQAISTVGLRNGKPLLHFEIRKNGKPVDPLRYLGKQ